jgi:hypothetical protein
MRFSSKSISLLLLLAAPPLIAAANTPAPADREAGTQKDASPAKVKTPHRLPEVQLGTPRGIKKTKAEGTADAPVDGLDGKPHDGPGLYPETKPEKGSGEVGVSGGGASVDITKPPPHTGEHEIVEIEKGESDKSMVRIPDYIREGFRNFGVC